MSLAEQIADLEEELEHYQSRASRLSNELADVESRLLDFESDCDEMGKFIAYVDKTHPELRTAYDASKVLEGAA